MVAGLVAAPAAPASGEPCASELYFRTLHVEAVPSKRKVTRGERFTVAITVTRPAHEDPLGQGIRFEPPMSLPAADIPIWISIWVGDWTYFWDVGITDENGEATLHLKVPRDSEYGWAFATAAGEKYQTNICPEIIEEGYSYYTDFVKVVR